MNQSEFIEGLRIVLNEKEKVGDNETIITQLSFMGFQLERIADSLEKLKK